MIRDEEFSTVFGGAISENILSLLSVAALLWLGLRSMRLILPMLGMLVLGLAVTAAFGTLFVGPYNPLSIAFAVLFIGLAVDFAHPVLGVPAGAALPAAQRAARRRAGDRRAWSPGRASGWRRWRSAPASWPSCRPTTAACPSSASSPRPAC